MSARRKNERLPRTLEELRLEPRLRAALEAARQRLTARFAVDRLMLFGSQVSGKADEESDADLLVVLSQPADMRVRNEIGREIFEINLEYEANLSEVIVDRESWERGMVSAMPIHDEIERTGIAL